MSGHGIWVCRICKDVIKRCRCIACDSTRHYVLCENCDPNSKKYNQIQDRIFKGEMVFLLKEEAIKEFEKKAKKIIKYYHNMTFRAVAVPDGVELISGIKDDLGQELGYRLIITNHQITAANMNIIDYFFAKMLHSLTGGLLGLANDNEKEGA